MSTSVTSAPDGSILTLEDVRRTLGATEVAVMRLIARGKLAATTIGSRGGLRIMASELTAYVKKGALDIDLPPLSGTWFSPADTRQAGGFRDAVFKAMDGQWPTNATVQKFATNEPDQMNFRVTVNAEGGRAVILQAPPSPLPGQPASRFENWGQIFLADAWREAVKKTMSFRTNVDRLYSSPDFYRSTLDEAWTLMQKKILSTSKPYAVQRRTAENVMVSMELPFTALNAYVNRAKLEGLTF